ncbi:MAG: DNA adenine methylase [Verrucomicrobia bacterium]|nr:DNA adenine methylase [Verrucomicrobiota bacterium]
MTRNFEPIIKWSGSKRSMAPALSRLFPQGGNFFDPFVGGGAILPYRSPGPAFAGDIIEELIKLWQFIVTDPDGVADGYTKRWHRLQAEGHTAYYDIRSTFNRDRDPLDLLFLSRTCVNGLIRFNSNGDFNNSLHHTRPGIAPERLRGALLRWSMNLKGVTFRTADYRDTLSNAKKGDVVFLDPPYACNKGRYKIDTFNTDEFFNELERLNGIGVYWVLTFDGHAGKRFYEGGVPEGIANVRLAIPTGNSPFTRLMRTTLDAVVESVYLNFNPASEALREFTQLSTNPRYLGATENVKQGTLLPRDKLHS